MGEDYPKPKGRSPKARGLVEEGGRGGGRGGGEGEGEGEGGKRVEYV